MNREIKFRVWDKEHKRFWWDVQHLHDTYVYDYQLPLGHAGACFGGLLDNEYYVVEQYTGLKDKNGKEIYEGHIIQRDDEEGTVGVVEFDKNEAKFVINDSGVRDGFDLFDRDEWEIIGTQPRN